MSIYFSDEQADDVDGQGLLGFAERVLAAEGLPPSTEMALLLVGPDQMSDYNRQFMGRQGPTDVLAFPVEDLEPGFVPRITPDEPPLSIGDVFVCPREVSARAETEGFDPVDFLYLIVAHGILHLLGYDHADEESADLMERREDELLDLVGRRIT